MYAEILEKINEARAKGKTSVVIWKPMLSGSVRNIGKLLIEFENQGYWVTELKNSFVFDWEFLPPSLEGLYEGIIDLLKLAMEEKIEKRVPGVNYLVCLPYRLPYNIIRRLSSDGFYVNFIYNQTHISKKERISLQLILAYLYRMAEKTNRNILF